MGEPSEGYAERMMIKEALRRLDAAIQDAIVARNMIEYATTETASRDQSPSDGSLPADMGG